METNLDPMSGFEVQPKKNEALNKTNTVFNEKNYLNVRLKDNETKKEIRIRTIPIDSTSQKHFTKIHMHNLKVDKQIAASGYKSYVCLEKTDDINHDQYGTKCPICEIAKNAQQEVYKLIDEIKKVGVDSPESTPLKLVQRNWKDIAYNNRSSEVGIVRCIERGHEEDGPKFWKINLHADKTDALSQIYDLFLTRRVESIEEEYNVNYSSLSDDEKEKLSQKMVSDGFKPYNLLDINEGKDLKITIEAVFDKDGKRTNRTSIKVIEYGNPKPLTTDKELLDKWINDEKKWNDVFVVKPYEYLSIIADGKYPFFDKEQGIWIEKEFKSKSNENQEEENNNTYNEPEVEQTKVELPKGTDSDLPF